MSVYVVLITHEAIGQALLSAAARTYGKLPLSAETITVPYDVDPDALIPQLRARLKPLCEKNELLILTDIYGSTPSNIAQELHLGQHNHVALVSGLNLPMLIRVMNYPTLPLRELKQKAISGGKDGVV